MLGFAGLVFFGGMLDTPGAPIMPAVYMGIAAIASFMCGAALANIYERGRQSV